MNLVPQIIGQKEFSGRVEVTDPCYQKGNGYTPRRHVLSGSYNCVVWRNDEQHHRPHSNRIVVDRSVYAVGIYHVDIPLFAPLEMKRVGYIGVDSGNAGIFMDKPNYSREEWSELMDRLHGEADFPIIDPPRYAGNFLLCNEGFFGSTRDGDGTCPVFAKINEEDQIVALEIRYYRKSNG